MILHLSISTFNARFLAVLNFELDKRHLLRVRIFQLLHVDDQLLLVVLVEILEVLKQRNELVHRQVVVTFFVIVDIVLTRAAEVLIAFEEFFLDVNGGRNNGLFGLDFDPLLFNLNSFRRLRRNIVVFPVEAGRRAGSNWFWVSS